jgi:hypothetical protein
MCRGMIGLCSVLVALDLSNTTSYFLSIIFASGKNSDHGVYIFNERGDDWFSNTFASLPPERTLL